MRFLSYLFSVMKHLNSTRGDIQLLRYFVLRVEGNIDFLASSLPASTIQLETETERFMPNGKDFEAFHGIEEVAELIRDKHVDKNLSCSVIIRNTVKS